jgi:pyruvate/2-oxoglutarate dehydrogenase complex dihydrolipoamide dehydrogenase (E3) component
VGLTVGVSPNIEFLKGSALETNRGILVNEFLETNIEGVFAVGDCAELRHPQHGRRPIEAVWYTGRMMGNASMKGDVEVTLFDNNTAIVGCKSAEEREKMTKNVRMRGKILDVSKDETKILIESYNQGILNIFRKNGLGVDE